VFLCSIESFDLLRGEERTILKSAAIFRYFLVFKISLSHCFPSKNLAFGYIFRCAMAGFFPLLILIGDVVDSAQQKHNFCDVVVFVNLYRNSHSHLHAVKILVNNQV
jgi:hypothetical protein